MSTFWGTDQGEIVGFVNPDAEEAYLQFHSDEIRGMSGVKIQLQEDDLTAGVCEFFTNSPGDGKLFEQMCGNNPFAAAKDFLVQLKERGVQS